MVTMESLFLGFLLFPFVFAYSLYSLKDEKVLWMFSVFGSGVMAVVSVVLLLNGEGILVELPLFTHFGIGFQGSPFALLYGVVSCFMWFVSVMASREYFGDHGAHLNRYYAALFVTLGGSLGVFFAYDLLTLFVFFEVMSFSSFLWVVQKEDSTSISASNVYLSFAVVGGLSVLLGIFALAPLSLDLRISELGHIFADEELSQRAVMGCRFLFLGFGAKAGVFLLHDWLPMAHTEAPAPASGLLSGLLTKCGVYGILLVMVKILPEVMGFTQVVLFFSVLNMLIGGLCAFLSGNLKRTLAFSSVSQIGFILWGICLVNLLGEHNSLAAYGTIFHMVNHSSIKILLFCLAGVVYQNAHTLELSQLKGYGRGKKWFQVLFMIGGGSLAGVPLLSGYVSKTLLHESMVEYIHDFHGSSLYSMYEWLFLLSGGFTVAYVLKLYFCLFVEEPDRDFGSNQYASWGNLLCLSGVSVILVILGVTPNLTFAEIGAFCGEFFHLHEVEAVAYFSLTNLKGAVISWGIGIGLFWHNQKVSKSVELCPYREKMSPDDNFVEKVYRPGVWIISLIFGVVARLFDVICEVVILVDSKVFFQPEEIPDTFFHGEENLVKRKAKKLRITDSLAFSLLMFGVGFVFTIAYLLVVGGTLGIDIVLPTVSSITGVPMP